MSNTQKEQQDFHALEFGASTSQTEPHDGRIVQDFSGLHWKMERMRVGQGEAEGLPLLKSELSGNNFSWNEANVPGDVYTDLFMAGEIEDPHMGRNMAKCKWVQDYEWWYNHSFHVSEEMRGKKLTLRFDGVDYSCKVWLNQRYLGANEGMFSPFQFDVTDLVDFDSPHVPNNLLTVKLDPPPKNQQNIAGLKHNFAGDYLTGVIPFGIWQPVRLIATDAVRIEHTRAEYQLCGDNAHGEFTVCLSGLHEAPTPCTLQIQLSGGGQCHTFEQDIVVQSGGGDYPLSCEIERPQLWYPYDLGEPFLYDLEVSIRKDGRVLDCITEKTGIREVKMRHNPGFTSEEVEFPWTFVINDKPMFLRSACWGGQPSFFYGRNSAEKYRHFLHKAKEANINNLRIFGWHPPETDDFYALCDTLGITVWTNFTFATQEFRNDEAYLLAVDRSVRDTVIVRRNHPSLVMWMGGEEVYFTEAHVHSDNRKLMERVGALTRTLTHTPYGDASPLSSREGVRMGYHPKDSAHANVHYYAAGAIFMEDYYPKLDYAIIPELTAASCPNVESLKKFIPQEELWPMGASYGYHMADLDVLKILNYEVFGDVHMESLEDFVSATQIAQGTIAQFALEHFRRQKPHVSGVSLCHFITNWPIIKWDIVDYYGAEKQSFQYVKRCYSPLLPSAEIPKRRYLAGEVVKLPLYTLNDHYTSYQDVSYSYRMEDMASNVLYDGAFTVDIAENSATYHQTQECILPDHVSGHFDITLTLTQNGEILAENSYRLLVADQEEAKRVAKSMYDGMHEKRKKYGKGYYRYFPELIAD